MNSLLSIYNDGSKNSVINDDNFLNAVLNYYKTSDRSHANLRNGSNGKSLSRINPLYDFLTGTPTIRDTTKVNKEDYEKYYVKVANGKDIKEVKKSLPKDKVTDYFKLLKAHDLVLENVK